MRFTRLLCLGLFLFGLLLASESKASLLMTQVCSMPLSGNYTINSGTATSGTNYASFTDAITDLTTCGVSGPVVFTVTASSGPYTEQLTMPAITGASATNTITFDGNGETLQFTPTSSSAKWIWYLNGADYVTITDLTIISNSTTYGWGILLRDNADHVTIDQCTIDLSAVTSTSSHNSVCVVASASTSGLSSGGNNAQNFILSNSTLLGGHYGIRHNGNYNAKQLNCRFENNVIQDFQRYGIYLDDHEQAVVEGNDLSRPNTTYTSTIYMMTFQSCTGNNLIAKNRIHNTNDQTLTSTNTLYGIYISSSDATVGNENQIINNALYEFNSNGTIYGIFNSGSDFWNIYHNTISFDHQTATATSATYPVYLSSTLNGISFINNNISLTRGGTGTKSAIRITTGTSSVTTDYNNYYVNATNAHVGNWSSTNFTTLVDWQSANGGIYGTNSISVNPSFANPGTGDLTPTNGTINDLGDNVGVLDDITGAARGSASDIGAWEFSGLGDDAGISAITSPNGNDASGLLDVTVEVRNFGANVLNSFNVYGEVTGPSNASFGPVAYSGSPIAVGTVSGSINLGNHNFSHGLYTIKAWTNQPNGTTDTSSLNDTATVDLWVCTMNGTYTINGGLPTGGSNYASFAEAINDLENCGVSGPVTFNVAAGSGPYTEQVSLGHIPGASVSNLVTFNGNGETLQFTPTSSSAKWIWQFDGADYVTLSNLNIESNSTIYGWGVHLWNSSEHITIDQCTIDLSSVTSTSSHNSACVVASNSTTSVSSQANNAQSFSLTNSNLIGGYYGVIHHGSSSAKQLNCQFENNTFLDFYSFGIALYNHEQSTIQGNDLSRPTRTNGSTIYGLFLSSCTGGNTILGNRIHNTHDLTPTSTGLVYGIYMSASDATLGNENQIINNAIYDINGNGTIYGIFNSSSDYCNIYHNTVSLDDPNATTTGQTMGFYANTSTAGIAFVNNNISIARAGTGNKYGINIATSSIAINADYNNYHINTTNGFVGYWNGTGLTTLADWQTANGGIYGSNSIATDPIFEDPGTGNYAPTSGAMNNLGNNLGIAVDIENTARGATPDMGAWEFVPPPNDVAMIAVASPDSNIGTGSHNVEVIAQNMGANSLTSFDCYAQISGPTNALIGPYTYSGTPIASSAISAPINIGSHNFARGVYTITAWTTEPNGVTDPNPNPDTVSISLLLCDALNGTYTINSALPTGGSNFASFADAIDEMENCGVSGPVTFNVTPGSGPYTEQVTMPVILGVSSTNTITFNGNGETLQFTPTQWDAKWIWQFDGADHVTLTDLTIKSNSTNYGWGVFLRNEADHITIDQCTIDLSTVTSTSSYNTTGIVASNSLTSPIAEGDNAQYFSLTNSTLLGGAYGISHQGSSSAKQINCRFENNVLRDFYATGIYLRHHEQAVVHGNDISRPTRTNLSAFHGIFFRDCSAGNVVSGNRIHNTHDQAPTGSSWSYGIYLVNSDAPIGDENLIFNNAIYNFNGQFHGDVCGIYNSSSSNCQIYHNTISLDNISAANGGFTTAGLCVENYASGITFINNNISVTRTNVGPKYGIYVENNTGPLTADYNNYYVNTTDGFVGHWNGSDLATLADWQAVNGGVYGANSMSTNPAFADPSSGNYAAATSAMHNAGNNLGVAIDIDSMARNATPDIGAWEFTPPVNDVGMVAIATPDSNIGTGLIGIEVIVQNFGSNPLTSFDCYAQISGPTNALIGPFTYSGTAIAAGAFSNPVNIGSHNFARGVYTITTWVTQPNGVTDPNTHTDTVSITLLLCDALNGVYTINSGLPTGGSNFNSFSDAIDEMVDCGVSGSVRFNVVPGSGPYTEQVSIPPISGASASRTITFNGNGETLQNTGDLNYRHTWRFYGADYVALKNFNIKTLHNTYGWGIYLTEGADYNTVDSCHIDVSSVNTFRYSGYIDAYGVVTSDHINVNVDGDHAQAFTLSNSTIIGGWFSVRYNGSSTGKQLNCRFENNVFQDFAESGLYLRHLEQATIIGNDFSRPNYSWNYGHHFTGIVQEFCTGGNLVANNTFHSPDVIPSIYGPTTVGVSTRNSDATPGNENLYINNVMYNIEMPDGAYYGFYNSGSDYAKYYNNSMSMGNPAVYGTLSAGLFLSQTAVGIEFKNNNVLLNANNHGFSGGKYGVYMSNSGSNADCDFNNYHITGTNAHIGYISGTGALTTLADWQMVNGGVYDQNSHTIDPMYTSPSTGNLLPANLSLDRLGTDVNVTQDILGITRNPNKPDIGAWEFGPPCQTKYDTSSVAALDSLISPSGLYVWTNTGTYQDTLPALDGCDSVLTVNFTLLGGMEFDTITVAGCDSFLSPSGNHLWLVSGTYQDSILGGAFGDTIITVHLSLGYTDYDTLSISTCDSYVSPSGNYTWTASGAYQDTLMNAVGCDSILTLNVTINYTDFDTLSITSCDSYVSPSGNYTWTTSGAYQDTLVNAGGCDSILTLNVTINYTDFDTLSITSCDSYVSPSGNYTWTTSGAYQDTLMNAGGCDSILTLNVTINNTDFDTLSITSCDSYVSPSGNYTWTTSGAYQDTLMNAGGCDSILTLNVTINYTDFDTLSIASCDSYISPSGSYTWTTSGAYQDTLMNAGGCDSILTLNVTINYTDFDTLSITSCDSYISPSGNYTWTVSGVYQDTLSNAGGCDSILTLNLTLGTTDYDTFAIVSCNIITSPSGNYIWTTSGVYQDTVANTGGCDSILTVSLTLSNNGIDTIDIAACDSFNAPSGNTTWTSAGLYLDTLLNVLGCDSIFVVDLTIGTNCPVNATVCSATEIVVTEYPFRSSSLACNTNVGTNVGSLPEPYGDPNTICGAINGVSVWYTFVSPSCSDLSVSAFDITLSTDNPLTDFNTVIRVFESDNDSCHGNFSEVTCALDGTPNGCLGMGAVGNSNLNVSATLDAGRRYFIMIDGESGATGTYEISLAVKPEAPTVTPGPAPQTQIDVTWPDVNSLRYDLYYSPLGGAGYNVINTSSTTHTLSYLQSGVTYEVWVGNACDTVASDFFYSPLSTITTVATACDAPTITCGTVTANSIEVVWTPVVDAIKYHVFYQVVGSSGNQVVWNVPSPNYTITGLLPNTNYKIWVYTVCPGPVSYASADLFCATNAAGSKPGNGDISEIDDPRFTFTYEGVQYVDYKLSELPLLGTPVNGKSTFEIIDGELVQFDMESNELKEGARTEFQVLSEFIISPNPITTDQTTITLDMFLEEEQDIQVYLYDMNGKRVKVAEFIEAQYHINETIQLGPLQSGMYQITVQAGEEIDTKRLVVIQ